MTNPIMVVAIIELLQVHHMVVIRTESTSIMMADTTPKFEEK